MEFRNKLVRFCPYTTLKRGSPNFEDSTKQHVRGLKTYLIYFIVATALVTPIAYGFFVEPPARLVTLSDLQMKILTDKSEYYVNETIKASLYVCNNYSYPVRIEPIREIAVSGNTIGDPDKISGIAFIDYTAHTQYLYIESNSSRYFVEFDLWARLPGEFQINMLGASITVNVTEN